MNIKNTGRNYIEILTICIWVTEFNIIFIHFYISLIQYIEQNLKYMKIVDFLSDGIFLLGPLSSSGGHYDSIPTHLPCLALLHSCP